jgi:RNA polymerase-binding transcription factor
MAGKKPGSKPSKLRKAASAKTAPRHAEARHAEPRHAEPRHAEPRHAEPRKAAASATSRKAVAATSVKAEGKVPKKPATAHAHPVSSADKRAERPEAAIRVPAPEPAHMPGIGAITVRARALPDPEESDGDGEGSDASSLLAGPRNVKPYVAKRGELYMSKEQLNHFQQILFTWKRDLMEEVDRTVSHMKDEAANFPDPNDRATQEEEFSLELRTRDRERKLIRKIDEALKRIEDGSYGYCLETGEEIGIKRLEARPVATLSIEAQERRERRERQYGDRDDRYR